jgi:chromosome segregation ATPase
MDMAAPSIFPQHPGALPNVRVEVRNGSSRPSFYDVTGEEFLVGSVPGCDLRLPGTNLPPVVCLIARQPDGIRLRKLAPTLPVLVNGQPISQTAPTTLTHGDCISIGAVDIHVAIDFEFGASSIAVAPLVVGLPPKNDDQDLRRLEKDLRERERRLEEQTRELEADRILWYRRRDEMDQEMQQARQSAARHDRSSDDLGSRERRLNEREEELGRRQSEIQRQQDDLLKLREETLATRRELNERFSDKRGQLAKASDSVRESVEAIRLREQNFEAELAARQQAFEDELNQKRARAEEELKNWHNRGASGLTHLREQVEGEIAARHRQRSEELDRFQLSLREAAVQLRERKQELDEQIGQYEPRRRELSEREAQLAQVREELDFRAAELEREREAIRLERQAASEPLVQLETDLAQRKEELERRLQQLDGDRELVDKGKSQYESDLVRLDRWQVALDERDRQLQGRATEIDQRYEQFQRDAHDLEEQVVQIDAREEQARAEEARLARQRDDLDQRETKLNERLAQIEGQQVMLASLRTRLEHMREEQRIEAARITDERARLDDHQNESRERLLDAERLREQLAGEKQGFTETERLFRERSEMLQQAVARLRELQQQLAADDERLRQAGIDLDARAAELAEREGLLQAKTEQLLAEQRRLEADRQALKQREESFFLTEGTRESLQEQLQRRAEELIVRGQELEARVAQVAEQRESLDRLHGDAASQRQQAEQQSAELARRDEELRQQREKLAQAELSALEQQKRFEEAQAAWELRQREADDKATQARREIDELKQALSRQAGDLFSQVPEMEARAQSALERTTQARDALRGQLTEMHAYAKQSQDDLEKVRNQVQAEIERLRQQETGLTRSRSEHRLAVSSFRQQLIEWQARFADMKQALSHGESRVERREKLVEATSQQLARQAEELEVKEREVAERRGEMERHLNDMREWYRKKLRELVESRGAERAARLAGAGDEVDVIPLAVTGEPSAPGPSENGDPSAPVILSLQDDLDPADRKLGELMRSLELVDGDTVVALWNEARRQHRPLRQVLLAGGYLTLYQLALIETGNLSGLVLGRFRVIDRLRSTPREAIYRAFDPQSGDADGVCVLRHLGESEMQDAVRPDEYRQRFGAARNLAHPNLAATREVLEINGRPAVVQERLRGLPGSEFPIAAGQPGAWFRLLSQSALGLHTAHEAGLVHGRLGADSLLLTGDGVLKIAGIGEPPWLYTSQAGAEPSAADDLRALGQIVFGWSQLAPKKKGKKGLPESLLGVLRGLGAESDDGVPLALFPSAAALLEDLDRASRDVPADVAAWEKLLEHVAANATDVPLLRQSA